MKIVVAEHEKPFWAIKNAEMTEINQSQIDQNDQLKENSVFSVQLTCCICRCARSEKVYDIQCISCKGYLLMVSNFIIGWFHGKCVGIPSQNYRPIKWHCTSCLIFSADATSYSYNSNTHNSLVPRLSLTGVFPHKDHNLVPSISPDIS